MTEQAFIVPAYVMDNRKFKETGEILVQVSEMRTSAYAEIMTPIGGLPNMAMQWVPPVGAHGYIMYKNGDSRKPVWIGSKLMPWDKAGATTISDVDLVPGVVEADDGIADFIIKTQNTTFENQDVDDAENNKVENILKMSKGEFTLAKVKQGDKYEYKTESYDIKTEPNYQIISMTDDKITVRFNSAEKDGEYAELNMTEGETKIITSYNNKTATITMSEGGVLIDSSETSTIQIDKDGNINITGKKMVVTADKIELGGNSNKAVLYEPLRDFIMQTYMTHVHPTPSGPSGPPPGKNVNLASKKVKLN